MKKQYALVALVAVVLGVGSFMGAMTFAEHRAKPAGLVDNNGNAIQQIALAHDKARPDTLTVLVGHTVQFNTADGLKHDMGEGEGGGHHEEKSDYESGEFGPGESWRVTFTKAGTYQLHDHEHPNINVLIVAYEPK